MHIEYKKGNIEDLQELIQVRIDYLMEDYGNIPDEKIKEIKKSLADYYFRHLNHDLYAYIAKTDTIISCCLLLIIEKPANPSFIHGKIGQVMNVYTRPEYRKRGIAGKLVKQILQEAEDMGLDQVELKATEAGYSLYKALGFEDDGQRYRNMKYRF